MTEKGCEGKIRLVTSDIFPSLTPFIRNGMVQATLFQNQGRHGYNCLSRLYRCIAENAEIQDQLYVPQIVTSSNLDDYLPLVDLENAVHENAKRGWNILQE